MKVKYPSIHKILLGGLALALVATFSLAGCAPSALETQNAQLATQNALLQQQNQQLQNSNTNLENQLDRYRQPPVIVAPPVVPLPLVIPRYVYPRPFHFPGFNWPHYPPFNWHGYPPYPQ